MFIARRRAAGDEALVVHRAHAQAQLPVRGTGGHIERAGNQDQLRARERHHAKPLGKADVKADRDAHLSKRRIEQREPLSRREDIRLPEALPARNVDIEQMHLAVLCDLLPLGREHIAGVIQPLPLTLRNRAADEKDAVRPCRLLQSAPRFAALRFCVVRKRRVIIGACPHLRQAHELRALLRRSSDGIRHGDMIALQRRRDRRLAQRKLHASLSFFRMPKEYVVVLSNRSPARRTADGKFSWCGASGNACVSRQKPPNFG